MTPEQITPVRCDCQLWQPGSTGKRHRDNVPGVLALDGAAKSFVCSSLANPAASHMLVMMANLQTLYLRTAMLGRDSSCILCLLSCSYKTQVPTRRRKGRNNRTIIIAASRANSLRARGKGKVWWTGWSKGSYLESWPVHKSFLFFTWSRHVCSQDTAWLWAGTRGQAPPLGSLGWAKECLIWQSSSKVAARGWSLASDSECWKRQLWGTQELTAFQQSLLRFCDSFYSSCQEPTCTGALLYGALYGAPTKQSLCLTKSQHTEKWRSGGALPEASDGVGTKPGQGAFLPVVSSLRPCTPPNPYHAD